MVAPFYCSTCEKRVHARIYAKYLNERYMCDRCNTVATKGETESMLMYRF